MAWRLWILTNLNNCLEMKLIKPSVEYIPQTDLYKHIELCSRVCYKSEDRITEDSAKKMVDGLIKSGHGAMLEHGTVYLQKEVDHSNIDYINFEDNYTRNPYSKIVLEGGIAYVTTNLRVLVENNWLSNLEYSCEPTEYHKKRHTLKFTCDIGTGREILRHRKFSFANESTRYCNYSKDKFGNEITFVVPTYMEEMPWEPNVSYKTQYIQEGFLDALKTIEYSYMGMLEAGASPQQARAILPLCTKSELIVTGFEDDWKHFLLLRNKGITGKPHPDMQYIAKLAFDELESKSDYRYPRDKFDEGAIGTSFSKDQP